MHVVRFVLLYIMLSIFGLLVCLFFAQNFHTEHLTYFGVDFPVNFVWVLLGAAASGFLLTVILLLPGHIAMAFHARRLEQEIRQLEEQVILLQEQRERMMDQHEDILAGHERILLRHQHLLSDYTQALAQLGQAQKQLAEHDQIQKKLAEQAEARRKVAEQEQTQRRLNEQRKLAEQERMIKQLAEQRKLAEEAQKKVAEREQLVATAPRVISVLTLPKNQRPPAEVTSIPVEASIRPQHDGNLPQQHDSMPVSSSQSKITLGTLGMLYKSKITRPVLAALALRPWLAPAKVEKSGDTSSSDLKADVSVSENYDN